MKKVLKPVYYCDHCKKHGLSASVMSVHEKKCWSNPDNIRACMDCIHLEEIQIPYTLKEQIAIDDFVYTDKKATGFRCKKLDKLIYHVKAEHKKLPEKYPETFKSQNPMVNECEHQVKLAYTCNDFFDFDEF